VVQRLIDEGQFGAPIILTPFNYRDGRQYGIILSTNYAGRDLSAYANLAFQSDKGGRSNRRSSTFLRTL